MWRRAIVTVGGLGLLRPAPGTWGSLPPCVLAGLFVLFGWSQSPILQVLLVLTVVISSVLCVALGRWSERAFHGKDPGVVVIDETAGMALTLLWVPLSGSGESDFVYGVCVIAAAFLLFRILDIVKVAPANFVQQFPAGWGILLDDLVVAVYGNVILQLFLRVGLPALLRS